MELAPEYCENIVVGVIHKRLFEWYVTPNDIWFLDLNIMYDGIKKWYAEEGRTEKRFMHEVGDFEHYCGFRYGIAVVDTDTADKFLAKIGRYRVETEELREWFGIEDDKRNVLPILLVDLDSRRLISYCPEPLGYENYVPAGWKGEYKDFLGLVPNGKIYWLK
ncbi:MAG: hypothetical protein IK990_12150 [Ruminiclostridium sp.]|nr:hypothetical protein [Ruminiclostridium sp.]